MFVLHLLSVRILIDVCVFVESIYLHPICAKGAAKLYVDRAENPTNPFLVCSLRCKDDVVSLSNMTRNRQTKMGKQRVLSCLDVFSASVIDSVSDRLRSMLSVVNWYHDEDMGSRW